VHASKAAAQTIVTLAARAGAREIGAVQCRVVLRGVAA
jgi:hypothetical protein